MGLDLLALNKMQVKILTLVVLVSFSALAESLTSFEKYQIDFGKEYSSPKEYIQRKAIFESNLKDIKNHNDNRGVNTYIKGINKFTDMTQAEFEAFTQGFPSVPKNIKKTTKMANRDLLALRAKYAKYQFEDSFSWVDEGIVTSVKDQGQCGSCTAFAVTGAVESCFIKNNGQIIDDLSEQYLVDCANGYSFEENDMEWTADGCAGAWPMPYFDFLKKTNGGYHEQEYCYPYHAHDQKCKFLDSCKYDGGMVTNQVYAWGTNEEELKTMVVEYGPVVTGLDASGLQFYNSGVMDSFVCCNAMNNDHCVDQNNHAVLVVGYGTEGGKDYWLVKNS